MSKSPPIALALLSPVVAGAQAAQPATSPPQACLAPAEMSALLLASREQAEDWCEDGDARALEHVRDVPRLMGRDRSAPGDAAQ